MSNIQTVKAKIKTELDALVTASTLGKAVSQSVKENPLEQEHSAYPVAVLTPPAIENEILDNMNNLRVYEFGIVLIHKVENLASTTALEETIEAIINHFDDHVSLDGIAVGGVEPASSSPAPLDYNGKSLVVTEITLRVKVDRLISVTGQ